MRLLFGSSLRVLLVAAVVLQGGLAVAQGEDTEGEGDTPAAAAPTDKRPRDDDSAAVPIHREGDYGGVVPDRANSSDRKAAPARPGKRARRAVNRMLVTWVGFQAREAGAARVFVQLSAPATYEQHLVEDTLVVFVEGVKLGTRNHGRFIDTSFFDTRVARIEARNVRARRGQKAGVEIVVHFKKGMAKAADIKEEAGPEGRKFLFLDFAP